MFPASSSKPSNPPATESLLGLLLQKSEGELSDTPPNIGLEVVIEVGDSPLKKDLGYWLPKLNLFHTDKNVLETNRWLNDTIIFAAQSILKDQFSIHGLQSTHLSQFQPVPPYNPFVQILHVHNSHWITVSNSSFGCGSTSHFGDCVKIYDSANPSNVSLTVQNTICSIMKPKSSTLTFEVVNVQSQMNTYDCGIFAIAFSTEIAYGHNPVLMQYDASLMRKHLIFCLEKKQMFRFPLKKTRRIPLGSRVKFYIKQPIYCTCRTVNDAGLSMILCDFCKGWFHYNCENIQESGVAGQLQKKWKCSQCKKILYM